MNVLYHVRTATNEPCHLTKDVYAEALNSWLCSGCAAPRPGIEAVDVQLSLSPSKDSPLNFVFGASVPIARNGFLFRLPIDVLRRDLYLGKVLNARGKVLDDWVTFRGRRRVIVRGSEHASYRVCDVCGRYVYFAMGKKYLFPAPPSDAVILQGIYGLVLPKNLFNELHVDDWPGLYVDELPILAEPLDGLGDLV